MIARFLSKPRGFTYEELRRLLRHFGYEEVRSGKTAGSRVAFVHQTTKHILRLHKPHPNNELKRYQMEQVIDELRSRGLL